MDAGTVIVAAIIASAVGALFYNALPLYVGSAQDYKGLDNRAIGFLTSSFYLGFNVVTSSMFFWIRRVSWRSIVAVSVPVGVLALYAGTLVDNYAVLLMTVAIAGGALAAVYGVGTTILGDTSNPPRWYGWKIAVETLTGAALLFLLPSLAISRWGFNGTVYGVLAAIAVLAPVLFWLPSRGVKGTEGSMVADEDMVPSDAVKRQTPYIWGTIAATLIFFSGASAIWAFLERIGVSGGYSVETIGILLSITLLFGVIGSIVAAVLGGRFGNVGLFTAGAASFVVAIFLLHIAQDFALYATGACLFACAFAYMLPVAVTEVAELDVDGRYVVLSVPALGVGAMIGPGLAGILTQSGSFTPLLVFGAGAVIAASVLMAIAAAHARSPAVARD
jgi:predicted MFS family arabinose efflux permease